MTRDDTQRQIEILIERQRHAELEGDYTQADELEAEIGLLAQSEYLDILA